jgi:hypothetical protein
MMSVQKIYPTWIKISDYNSELVFKNFISALEIGPTFYFAQIKDNDEKYIFV